jgi:hypothetical protein
MDEATHLQARPRYRWPWYLLGAVLLAIALGVVWVAYAVHDVRKHRDPLDPRLNPAGNESRPPGR